MALRATAAGAGLCWRPECGRRGVGILLAGAAIGVRGLLEGVQPLVAFRLLECSLVLLAARTPAGRGGNQPSLCPEAE
jgi:hypothetical protein